MKDTGNNSFRITLMIWSMKQISEILDFDKPATLYFTLILLFEIQKFTYVIIIIIIIIITSFISSERFSLSLSPSADNSVSLPLPRVKCTLLPYFFGRVLRPLTVSNMSIKLLSTCWLTSYWSWLFGNFSQLYSCLVDISQSW